MTFMRYFRFLMSKIQLNLTFEQQTYKQPELYTRAVDHAFYEQYIWVYSK